MTVKLTAEEQVSNQETDTNNLQHNTTQFGLHTAANKILKQTLAHFTHCTTRTARRGRPFRHRCVKLRSPSLEHFNARLPRSFL